MPASGTNQLVVITGSSGGIGLNLTSELLKAGWKNIVCQYRTRPEPIQELLKKRGLDPAARSFAVDLTQEQEVMEFRRRVEESFGPAWGIVNAAGGSSNCLSWKLPVEEFRRVLDMNLLTTFLCCREFVPAMRRRAGGRIINISSVVAFTGAAGTAHYSASKAAVIGFSQALAQELAPRNIAVSAVALGYFNCGLINTIPAAIQEEIRTRIPARRFGSAGELGGLIHWLLGEGGGYSGGQVYHLNGGLYT